MIADIDATTPITDRRAHRCLQGITGLLFIDLQQDPKAETTGALAQGQRYPVIRSGRSDFDVLLSSLPALTTHLVEMADRFNQVFSDENVRGLKTTLDNIRVAGGGLPDTLHAAQQLLVEVRRTMQEVQGTVAQLHGLIAEGSPDLEAALANIRRISDNLAQAGSSRRSPTPQASRSV